MDAAGPDLRAAAYLRVSTEEQAREETIEAQADFADRWFALYGIQPVRVYRDEGVSGFLALEERRAGAQLMADAAAGTVNAVYMVKVDRFSRNLRVLLNAVHVLEGYGCRIVSLTESFDTSTPAGRMTLAILGAFAQFERDSIAERTQAGKRRRAREGRWLGGGSPPYGYRVEDGRLAPDETPIPGLPLAPADVVRLIFRLLVTEGLTAVRIAGHLNSLAIPTPKAGSPHPHWRTGKPPSGRWRGEQVQRVIHAPVYTGVGLYGRRAGKRSQNGTEPPVEWPAPPLVDRGTWEAAQARLTANRDLSAVPGNRRYLLRGLMKCAGCGNGFSGTSYHGRWSYYVCTRRLRSIPGEKCASAYVPQDYEETVWQLCGRRLFESEFLASVQIDPAPDPEGAAELARLDAALAEKGEERERMLTLYRRGRIAEADLDRELDAVEGETRTLRERRATLTGRLLPSLPGPPGEGLLPELQAAYRAAKSYEERRAVVEQLIAWIEVRTVGGGRGSRRAECWIQWRSP